MQIILQKMNIVICINKKWLKDKLSYDEELMMEKYKYASVFNCPINDINDDFMNQYYGHAKR